ncbi:MAG TPA: phosphopantetheine-binding protein [Bryobacteraceae bacterium]|nr:phosphopantetheine-binding protein [Bryobacteraceae bacterium]
MSESLIDRVTRVIAETQHIPAAAILPQNTFEELKIDSLDGINILFALENEFNISIPDEQAKGIQSVQDLTGRLANLLDKRGVDRPE